MLIINNPWSSRKRCHWSSCDHSRINGNWTQSLNPIDFILTSSSSVTLSRVLVLAALSFSLSFDTLVLTLVHINSLWSSNSFSAICSLIIFVLHSLRRQDVLLLQQLLLRQFLIALIFKDILRNWSNEGARIWILFLICVLIHLSIIKSHHSYLPTIVMLQYHIIWSLTLIMNSIDIWISLDILLRLLAGSGSDLSRCIVSCHLLLQELLHRLVMLLVTGGVILLLKLVHPYGVVLTGTHAFDILRELVLKEVWVSWAEVAIGRDLFTIGSYDLGIWFFGWNYRNSGNSRDGVVYWVTTFSIIII